MIVEGGYNLPERTPVKRLREDEDKADAEKDEAKAAPRRNRGDPGRPSATMSLTLEPETEQHARRAGGINLVALARPYFGLIVLTTSPADRLRRRLDAPHAQRHLSRGRLPADRRHRPDAGPGGQGRRGRRHAADRGGGQHRAGRDPRPVEVGAGRRRAVDIDFAPGTDMIQALNDVRARMAEVGAQLPAGHDHDHRAADPVGLPDHLVRRHRRPRPVGAPRLRLLRPAAADQPHPRRLLRHRPGGRHPRDPDRGRPAGPGRRPTSRSPTWPTASARSTGSRPSAGSIASRCNTRCWPTRWPPIRSTWKTG